MSEIASFCFFFLHYDWGQQSPSLSVNPHLNYQFCLLSENGLDACKCNNSDKTWMAHTTCQGNDLGNSQHVSLVAWLVLAHVRSGGSCPLCSNQLEGCQNSKCCNFISWKLISLLKARNLFWYVLKIQCRKIGIPNTLIVYCSLK